MTKKDFTLIGDAVNAAIKRFFEHKMLREDMDLACRATGVSFSNLHLATRIENELRAALADEFASRLAYTADDFNGERFRQGITVPRIIQRT